jgi:hypothetical protein
VQIARPAASGADGEFSRQMRLSAGGKCGNLLVPDMKPLDFAVPADSICQTVQAVADNAVDAFHACGGECFNKLVSHCLCHGYSPVIEARRPTSVRRGEFALKIKTALLQQSHVEDQTGAAIRRIGPEKIGNGRKLLTVHAERS